MTTPDIDAIARDAASEIVRLNLTLAVCSSAYQQEHFEPIIAIGIRRAIDEAKEDFETAKAIERGAALEAIRQRDEAIEVLKSVEWVIKTSYGSTCPVCLWWNETGHKPDCKLAKAIGK